MLDYLPQQIHRKCLRYLYRICGRQALLPKSLPIPLCFNPAGTAQCSGGFADVWKGEYNGKEVAAKGLRIYLTSDLEQIRKAGCPQLVMFINELTAAYIAVLQGGRDLEDALPSECVATIGCNNDRGSVRDGIGMDEEWEHQRVCEVTS